MDLRRHTTCKPNLGKGWYGNDDGLQLVQAFREILTQVKAVSFDVFDTTLQRVVFPKEVFALVETKLRRRFGQELHGYADLRVTAERRARLMNQREVGHGEVGMEAIYRELIAAKPAWKAYAKEVLEMEFAEELRCSRPHPLGQQLWRSAISAGHRICFVSDMYLGSARIASLLKANGYTDPRVICSGDHGKNKSSGELYRIAAEQLGLEPGEILHVGDNIASDQKQALRSGLKSLPFPAPPDPPQQAKHFPKVTELQNSSAVTAGLIRWETTSLVPLEESAKAPVPRDRIGYKIGFSALGPLTYALCHWLVDRISQEQRDLVLFLGRDGYLPLKILSHWQSCYGCLPNTRLEYFPSSRRATALACAAGGVSPLVRDTLGHHRRSVPLRDYFERIGLDPEDHLGAIASAGLNSPDELIHRSKGRPKMERLIELLEGPLKQIGNNEKMSLLEALNQKGFREALKPAIFDLGWRGTQQACLQSILGDSPELHGYYLSISDTFAASNTTTGYLVNNGRPGKLRGLFESATPVVELFYSSPDPSLLYYRGTSENVHPIYDTANPNSAAIQELHAGAVAFIDAFTALQDGPTAPMSQAVAVRGLAQIVVNPPREALGFLQNLVFSDALGRENGQALTATRPPPLRAFFCNYPKFFEAYSETFWRAHFIREMSLAAKLWVWPRSPSFRRVWRTLRELNP